MVTVNAFGGGSFEAYLALPPSGRGPAIVVLQEIFGVNHAMRAIADWYAERGFVAICPDLFWRQEPGVQLTDQTEADRQRAFELYKALDEEWAMQDIAETLAFIRKHPACTGRVGSVGFCLGGKLAYLLAVTEYIDCSVCYYGVGIESVLVRSKGIDSPMMLHVAEKDPYCPPEAQACIREVLGRNKLVTIHDYPRQDHAFARVGGLHYDAAAAELANLRSVDFLTKHLFGAAPSATSLSALWDEHVKCEFAARDTEATIETMDLDAYVNHVPVLTGGAGHGELREFYSKRFIPQMPPDTAMTPVSRTIGVDRVVDEMVFEFTHTTKMDWMLPGVPPTGRRVKVALVVIVHFREGRIAHEHIYWDQASVLAQLGLISTRGLPVAGVESAEKVLDPALPSNRPSDLPRDWH